MAMQLRPRTLAGGFGAFFLVMALGGADALPPPLPEEPVRDHVDRDIDDLLESLSEMETTVVQAAEAGEPDAPVGSLAAVAEASPAVAASRDLITKRERARRVRNAGPGGRPGAAR